LAEECAQKYLADNLETRHVENQIVAETSFPASIFDRGAVDRGEVPLYHLAGSGPGQFLDDQDISWPVRAQLLLGRAYQLTP